MHDATHARCNSYYRSSESVIRGYHNPPKSPEECIFSRTTLNITAHLKCRITQCQFGGELDVRNAHSVSRIKGSRRSSPVRFPAFAVYLRGLRSNR